MLQSQRNKHTVSILSRLRLGGAPVAEPTDEDQPDLGEDVAGSDMAESATGTPTFLGEPLGEAASQGSLIGKLRKKKPIPGGPAGAGA